MSVSLIRQWLDRHARERPESVAFTSWSSGLRSSIDLTFGELAREAAAGARRLRDRGLAPGDRVVLVLPNSLDFVTAFCAVVDAGGIAVPAPIPSASRPGASDSRIASILRDCAPVALITTREFEPRLQPVAASRAEVVVWGDAGGEDGAFARTPDRAPGRGDASALVALQYTSGSTNDPKGVEISQSMLAEHCRQACETYGELPTDVAVTWVPLFHDMGLITGLIRPLRNGYRSVLMSPEHFAASPVDWLRLVSRERATLSSSPNFGYDLCTRRVDPADLDGEDLSTWRVARNAGEVAHARTLQAFTEKFAPFGFRRERFCPSYGMAEATLTVTSSTASDGPVTLSARRSDLLAGRVREHPDAVADIVLVSSGRAVPGTEVLVGGGVDEGVVGVVSIRGPQVFAGYWGRPRARTDGFFATGDQGFMWNGELFVLGRESDMLSVNGRNYHLHADVLPCLLEVAGLRPGRIGVVKARKNGMDQVHLVSELPAGAARNAERLDEIRREARAVLVRRCGLHVSGVHFCRAGALPVTTSGKVRLPTLQLEFAQGALELL